MNDCSGRFIFDATFDEEFRDFLNECTYSSTDAVNPSNSFAD
jgi:hypothetical protein